MVSFKIESWIWFSVVMLIAVSRLYAFARPKAPIPHATIH